MIEALLVAGCYLAFLSNASGAAAVVRPLTFAFLMLAALLAIMSKRVQRIATTPTEILLYAVGFLSAAVSLVRGEEYCIYFTIYYLSILIFVSIIARTVTLERMMDLAAYVVLLCIATSILFASSSLIAALKISIGPNGLERFGPFNNHPLLTGYIFGSGSLLLARRVYLARTKIERYVMLSGVLLSWIIVLAASSRSSIIALMVAAAFALLAEFNVIRRMTGKQFTVMLASVAAAATIYFWFASSYLLNILEIDSSYRGFGTGATGRTDLWAKGWDALFADPTLIAFGGGLRSSEYTVIGFLTENSYITILLDSGIFIGAALILSLLYSPIKALRVRHLQSSEPKNTIAFYASIFVFLAIQCFFLRYFIGIGNPTSLLTLFLVVSLSLYPGFRALSRPVAAAPVSEPSLQGFARAKV